MYESANSATDSLNLLISLFANSENAFRLYTVDYDANTFKKYTEALDSVNKCLELLAHLPMESNPLANAPTDMAQRNVLASEYALLKKTVERLIQHTQDSLQMVTYVLPTRLTVTKQTPPNTVATIAQDTTVVVEKDTIIRKRKSLLRRIFDAGDDTIVVDVRTTHVSPSDDHDSSTSIPSPHATTLVSASQHNLTSLRSSFTDLQEKERDLIHANFALLNHVRNGIEKIRLTKMDTDRATEKQDFDRYRANVSTHNRQLVLLLSIMLAMIVLLWYYTRRMLANEITLENERSYVSNLAEEKSAVLAGISHEIRTPLVALLGTVDMMRNDETIYSGPNGATYKQLIDTSYNSLNGINLAVADILNLSRLESGSETIVMKYFSPFETLNSVITLQKQQIRQKGLTIRNEINIQPQLAIWSNEFRIKQITTNLIGNAIKYTNDGHILLKADIVNSNKQPKLRLVVQDTGMGIPTAHLPNIFRKYYTIEKSKTPSAFGLGLYITKLLTDELEGTINVTSEVDRGSTFVVEIPFKESEIIEATHPEDELESPELPNNVRFLVVDDNPMNILYMQQFFSTKQQHVNTVNTAQQALLQLEKHPYDILITDINMPEMDGWDLLQAVKSSGKYPNLKVLALSADNLEVVDKNERKERTPSFDAIIPKPFSENDFARIVSQALDSSRT